MVSFCFSLCYTYFHVINNRRGVLSSKTPIKHLNGDTLDNRKCNLETVERNTRNDYKIVDNFN